MAHILSIISLAIPLYVNYAGKMKKLTPLLTAVLLTTSLVACSNEPNENSAVFETIENPATILPTIDMVATHAIDLDTSISQLTFVPNSVAPWLGRIIIRDDDGFLFSTDIEGREPKPVGTGKYIDIFGLAREAAPGVFLAITEDNKIEAFIETDNEGSFSPLIYSGESIKAQALCLSKAPSINNATVLTMDGKLNTLDLKIQDTHIEQSIMDSAQAPKRAKTCTAKQQEQKDYEFALNKGNRTLKARSLVEGKLSNKVNVTNGLSVRGAQNIKHVASTQSNYGGGAYAKGVLALVDKDEQRIVFISMSYAERQLLKAVNQPEDAPQ